MSIKSYYNGGSDVPRMERQRGPSYIMNEEEQEIDPVPRSRVDNLSRYVKDNLSDIPYSRHREYR